MKKIKLLLVGIILSVMAMAVFGVGCGKMYPPPATPVCAAPGASGSVICATAARLNTTPEQIDTMFLDAALVGIGTKVIQAPALRAAVTKSIGWVDKNPALTIDALVKYLVKESDVDPALALLLSRRLGVINLPDLGVRPVTAYDVTLIRAGLNHQLEQLSWF